MVFMYSVIFGNMRFSPDALARNARSLAHFAATIGAYKMPMTNLLETFSPLSSASRPGCYKEPQLGTDPKRSKFLKLLRS